MLRLPLFTLLLCFILPTSQATTWYVGPTRIYPYCSQIAGQVQNGDTILIDAATYVNDPQVIWNKSDLYIAGIGGRPRLEAGSIIANDMSNGKGIFVISGANVHVHNIEFARAVVQDNNGAGIRQEGANLWVSNCRFDSNEMGILGGNIANCKTTVEYCEFVNNGSIFNPGYQHNIYINHIDSLVFRFNYSHDAIAEGHELKSRATYNFILYNRIANESGDDSRTIDLPNGGTSVIVGNVIEQGPNSANSNILGYGLEGLTNNAPHHLFCCNNTFINKKSNGSFIQVANGMDTLFVKNNIFAGPKPSGLLVGTPTVLDSSNNAINNDLSVFGLVDVDGYDYHLLSDAPVIDKGVLLTGSILGHPLQPFLEYKDTCSFVSRDVSGITDIGAYEFAMTLATAEKTFSQIALFPNPASGDIQILLGDQAYRLSEAALINNYGVVVRTQKLQPGNNGMDITSLTSGVYYILLVLDEHQEVRKIIIQ
ncbi:MAG: T9SS type A sorting domain-containing protein [Saprospiraceae bacterium]|nr:T9SS type A sorting domain-containing protein [Candidatus Opimibacter iunctus]